MKNTKIRISKVAEGQLLKIFLALSLIFNIVLLLKPAGTFTLKQTLNNQSQPSTQINADKDKIYEQINPSKGYEINASYNDLGPKMIKVGVIDFDKFKQTYERSGKTMPQQYADILQKGSNKKIRITRDNSYFLLNFFWAVGLTNKSKILESGTMMSYGGLKGAGGFASTGGWILAKSDPMNYYSKTSLIPLTKDQEDLVESVSSNIYRPCCDNSTSFPDCNHGMALLGALQLMAQGGATEKELYAGAKYFNAFFFPGNYYDLALYFKNKEKKNFSQVDGKLVVSKEYSSATGWQNVKKWLSDNRI